MRSDTHRRAVIVTHRARGPAGQAERETPMESYRTQIIHMLDTVQDVRVMRLLYEVVKAILMNR